ncbi:retrovirus-related Pol polyprotein from transposon opus [Trichonephila clavipes]|nr:retrovirus-related Pol polyprotein from transposon opus [Trichonephila clavipes]
MGPKKTLERIKYSFFWEGLRADVKKFCESCKECQLTRSVRIKDRSSSTPVARPELPFEVRNMDLIGGACKELLPAPGNRSNKRRDREEDLATTEEERSERERGERERRKKPGS